MYLIMLEATAVSVPDKEAGSCLDPELPGTGLQTEGGEGPGPPYSGEKSQLEPGRDGENDRGGHFDTSNR